MSREDILSVIEKHVRQCDDEFENIELDPNKKLTDYGVNSLDVVEIVSGSMRELRVKIPRPELSNIANINGLVDKFIEHAKPAASA